MRGRSHLPPSILVQAYRINTERLEREVAELDGLCRAQIVLLDQLDDQIATLRARVADLATK